MIVSMYKMLTMTIVCAWCALPVGAQNAAHTPDQQAKDVADVIRQFNETLGEAVDGELDDRQIDLFEQMISPALDVERQHDYLCGLAAMQGAMQAGLLLETEQRAAASSNPVWAEMVEEMRRDVDEDITIGSLEDWLYQFSLSIVPSLGFDRTVQAAKHECLQQPMSFVRLSNVPMTSERMRVERRCREQDICQ